ncbi:uncharacterized protein EV420DRAFT_1587006 [Desarmillaria tabescens]|uniref:MYND-type domain-containing protein n=1 Tax=Armillaria tabescens TaxID=1929756 RepID=A0AA39MK73_ARMTA|nr:uncharacterized protein EV420DRAFT_1587006 [Desarmillaria tabescens]KAK0437926.1 hypothetical protein EV420DRAFT_1587006 [Desarmillaria tabescens]
MDKSIKSAKDGSFEAMMALALQAGRNRRAHQAFFRVVEENLRFNTPTIQALKRGSFPLVPSLDPKDVVNRSCTSMLALATGIRDGLLLQPACLAESTSSMFALMPAISFWLSLFCERIITPSRTPDFKFMDFHHAVVFILAWTTNQKKLTLEPKIFTDYLPFLWFNPPPGCAKYNLDDARSVFTAVYHAVLACESTPWRGILVDRMEENSTLTAKLVVQFIVDGFAHLPEEPDATLLSQTFLTVAASTLQLSVQSLPIHTALLRNNSIQWMALVLRYVTRRTRFTYVALRVATDCVSRCLRYILRVMQDGHSYIYQFLGYDILPCLLKAFRNMHAHPELIDQEFKGLKTLLEDHAVEILHLVISHFAYASILKRTRKAISKIRRLHVDGFLESKDLGLKRVCEEWTQFVNIAFYRSDMTRSISDSSCGNGQCPGTFVEKFTVCSGCQFTRYCSRTCQKDDWSRTSTGHRSLCNEIKEIRTNADPLPMSFSDRRAIATLNSHYVEYHEEVPSEREELLDEYTAENGEPDPLWPLVLVLDYRAINVEPYLYLESSEQCVEDWEIVVAARRGAGTIVGWIIPDGQRIVTKVELVPVMDLPKSGYASTRQGAVIEVR